MNQCLDTHLETALGLVNLLRRRVDATQEHRLAARKRVHRLLRNVEPAVGVVDREDVDALALVRQLPARPALVRVPSRDRGRAADVGEVGQ